MPTLRLLAPAKLNLFLHILGRRPDGYHELQTLFQLLDFGDWLQFEVSEDPVLSLHVDAASSIKDLPLEGNLILQAATRLQAICPEPRGVSITIEKHIPMGGGLGGGSADAGITLRALNELWDLHLPATELMAIGQQLGADVPVFVLGQSAWAEGIGERLQPVSLPPAWYLVLTPACEVATAAVFTHEQLTRNSSAIKMADFLAGRSRNDCEPVSRGLYAEVDTALNWLEKFAPARMTGTGAAVFASFDTEAEARAIFEQRPAELDGFIAQGLNSLESISSGD